MPDTKRNAGTPGVELSLDLLARRASEPRGFLRVIWLALLAFAFLLAPAAAQEKKTCDTCKGKTKVECRALPECEGKSCGECGGAGRIDCPDCRPLSLAKLLSSIGKDVTTLQRDTTMAKARGKRVEGDVELVDVKANEVGGGLLVSARAGRGGFRVSCKSGDAQKQFLAGLAKGKYLKVTGRIEQLTATTMELEDCVYAAAPQPKVETPKVLDFDKLCQRVKALNDAKTPPDKREKGFKDLNAEFEGKIVRIVATCEDVRKAVNESGLPTVHVQVGFPGFISTVAFDDPDDGKKLLSYKKGTKITLDTELYFVPNQLPNYANTRLR